MSLDLSAVWLALTRVVIIIFSVLLAWVTYRSNLLLKEYRPDFNLLLSPPELVVRVLLVGICFLLAWLSGLPVSQLGLTSRNPLQTMGIGIGLGLALVIIINLLTAWSINRFGHRIYSPFVIRNILPRRPIEWGLIAFAFVPAVAMEELLFRTLWLGGFGGAIPMPLLIIGTSILFGVMHQPQGQLGMMIAGSINAFFSIIFIWTGELLMTLTAHYVVNVLQLVLAYYQKSWLEHY